MGVVKGAILKHYPQAVIVDISHNIRAFSVGAAALVLKHSYRSFPKGSTHIIGVSASRTATTEHLAVKYDGHYFIGADNGVFTLLFEREPEHVVDLSHIRPAADTQTFPTRDIFTVAACHLAQEGIMEVLGRAASIQNVQTDLQPTMESHVIRGKVIHIDSYGNAITNIDRKLFEMAGQSREFEIRFRRQQHVIRNLSNDYFDVPSGEKLALFNSSGHLEIAMNRGRADQLLGIKTDDTISICFS